MEGVPTKAGAILLHTQFFTTRLSPSRVVVIAAFFADEENRFGFLLAFGHQRGLISIEKSGRFLNLEGGLLQLGTGFDK